MDEFLLNKVMPFLIVTLFIITLMLLGWVVVELVLHGSLPHHNDTTVIIKP